MTKIVLGNSKEWGRTAIEIDVERLIVSRLLVQANSGGGKSYALRRLLEQLSGVMPHVVIDLDGEFATLREKFPYVLASAGAGGDCKVDARTAKLLARRVLEHGFSVIVDLSEMPKHGRAHFVRLFLEALLEAPRNLWRPLLVVVDEAHQFCPEKEQAESAAAVIDLMTRGRKRGFCGVLATQRISKLHKDAAAEANNKLIGRSALDVDMKRAADELGFSGKEQQASLRNLEAGHFFAFGPAISKAVVQVKVGAIQTTHPEPGHGGRVATPPAPEKLKKVLESLADLPRQAEAEEGELERLRRENADLRRKAAAAPAAGVREETAAKAVGVAIGQGRQQGYLACLDGLKPVLDRLSTLRDAVVDQVDGVREDVARLRRQAALAEPGGKAKSAPGRPAPGATKAAVARLAACPASGDSALPGPQQRILDALAWLDAIRPAEPADRVQLALLAGYSPNSSGYHNNLGALRSAGLIDYPQGGQVILTEAGHGAARAPAEIPTTGDLHRTLQEKLPQPQWRILEALIQHHPDAIGRADLAEVVGYSPESSGFHNNLGALRSLGFIDYPKQGSVVALPCLFLEERK